LIKYLQTPLAFILLTDHGTNTFGLFQLEVQHLTFNTIWNSYITTSCSITSKMNRSNAHPGPVTMEGQYSGFIIFNLHHSTLISVVFIYHSGTPMICLSKTF